MNPEEILKILKEWLMYKYVTSRTARDFYNDHTSMWSKGYKKGFEETLDYIKNLEKR